MVRRIVARGAMAGLAVLLAEALFAVLRPVPSLVEFDPSGTFGDDDFPELRVAVLGDSSVTAPGVSSPDDIWVRRVCQRLGERFRINLRSFAVGGSRAVDLIQGQLEPAIAFGPHLVFVSVGANDVIRGVTRKDFERQLDELVSKLSEANAIVVQSGVGDMGTIPRLVPPLENLVSNRSLAFDAIHKAVARRHGSYVVEQHADSPEIWHRDRSLWADDLFHVSADGHRRWADLAWETVESLIPQLSAAS